MKIVDAYSHLHGYEFLSIHRREIDREIRSLVKACSMDEFRQTKAVRSDQRRSRQHDEQVMPSGWRLVQLALPPSFEKDRIGLKWCFDIPSTCEQYEFDEFSARYRADSIDLGIAIFPGSANTPHQATVGFDEAVTNLKKRGRSDPIVPLLLYAVAP